MAGKLFLVVGPNGTIGVVTEEPGKDDLDEGEIVHRLTLSRVEKDGLRIMQLLGKVYSDEEPFFSLIETVARTAFALGQEQAHLQQ